MTVGRDTAGSGVLERLGGLPGGAHLLRLAAVYDDDVELVGGAVRDILLDRPPRELDVRVTADAPAFAAALARRLAAHEAEVAAPDHPRDRTRPVHADALAPAGEGAGEHQTFNPGEDRAACGTVPGRTCAARPVGACTDRNIDVIVHERFGTALVRWESGEIDVATCRSETYPTPGALPIIAPGTPEQDLLRRDFTVNALAVSLARPIGELRAVPLALEDLERRRLRVLHERSFSDDPTRLLRLARYSARLAFTVEPGTARLAEQALHDGALGTVSGARIGAELRLALCEADALGALSAMEALGLFSALHSRLSFDAKLARKALDMLAGERGGERAELGEHPSAEVARRDLLLLAALFQPMLFELPDGAEKAAYALLNELEFPAADRELALHAAICADAIADDLAGAETPSEVYESVWHLPAEAVALAGAWADLTWGPICQAASMAEYWLGTLRHVRPGISGNDLIAAGVPEGPEIGWRMREAHKMLLDGEIAAGRESELRAALDATL